MKISRLKLLISSVSMLLVAAMSLSVATYAWFTNQSEATASGISIRTENKSLILLSTDNTANSMWKNIISLDVQKFDLKPVSTVNCENWFTTNAQRYDVASNEVGGRGEIREVGDDWEDYYIAKEFYVKANSDLDMTAEYGISAMPASGDYDDEFQLEALRVALVYEDYFSTGNVFKTSRFYSYDDYVYKAIKNRDGDLETVKGSDYVFGTIRLKARTPQKVTLYAWFEGEDPSCIDSTSGVRAVIDVAFQAKVVGGGTV
jgi:hypothetical protein